MKLKATDDRRGRRTAWWKGDRGYLVALAALLTVALPALGAGSGPVAVEPVAAIEAAAHSYIQSLLASGATETQITVQPLDQRLRLALCASPLTAQMPAGGNLSARTTVGVSCASPVHWSVYVPVILESRIPVLVLKHPVTREARLTVDDVTVETRRTAGLATAYLGSAADLTGRTVRRPLAIGTVLTAEMFVADMVVHRGQEVTLVAGGPSMEIRAMGRAMNDAAAGARVQVQNLSSMTVVEGVVESSDLVRVAL